MRTALPSSDYTVRQAAWLLGVTPSVVHRSIRLGTLRARWRRGRFVIPAELVVRLLGEPRPGGAP